MTRRCGLLAGRGRSCFGTGNALALAAIAFLAAAAPANPDRSTYPGDPRSNKLDAELSRIDPTDANNKARIWLRVPANAQIWIQGVKTKQTGEFRYFFSPPLTPGKQYSYRVRLRWTKHGKVVEESQRLIVSAGAWIHRDYRHARSETNPEASRPVQSDRPFIRGR